LRRQKLDPAPMLTAARGAHPSEFELAFVLGQLHRDYPDGRQIGPYEAARALRPESFAVWVNLGNALPARKDADGPAAAFRRAAQLAPNHAPTHSNLGIALRAWGDLDGAVAALRRAIELDPHYAPAHYSLGNILRDKGDVDGAFAAFKRGV